jgi:outer membrane lipoprotein SlyB
MKKSSLPGRMALLAMAACALPGCATITRGSNEAFVVESTPIGAEVRLSTGETCKTPCTLKKKRKDNFVVFINREGFEPVEVSVISETAGAGAAGMAGNVLVGGIIGLGVDAATGATKKLTPNPVRVTLNPLTKAQ